MAASIVSTTLNRVVARLVGTSIGAGTAARESRVRRLQRAGGLADWPDDRACRVHRLVAVADRPRHRSDGVRATKNRREGQHESRATADEIRRAKLNIAGMVLTAAGMLVQIAAGSDLYPSLAGPIALVVTAMIVAIGPGRWTPYLGLLVPLGLGLGAIIAAVMTGGFVDPPHGLWQSRRRPREPDACRRTSRCCGRRSRDGAAAKQPDTGGRDLRYVGSAIESLRTRVITLSLRCATGFGWDRGRLAGQLSSFLSTDPVRE